MENIIYNAVLLLISIGGFLLGKFIFPNVPKSVADKLRQLAAWADKFVVWAREFRKQDSGPAKMELVVEQLKAVAKEAGWDVTEDQLRAIAQAAYENMLAGAAEAQQPQEPADGGNDYTPPVDYRPSQRPTRPSTSTKPTGDSKPQTQPDTPAPAKPQLACNGAVIDTSRTVVLLGYGDGLLHENDPLTRAQLATIIYRILDDDSIAKFSNAQVAFTDVAADAWYAPYVRVIQASRIANGVGGGKYDPNGKVTWTQILAILSRFVEQKEYTLQHIQYSGWAQGAIETAVALGWIEDNANFIPDAVIGRGELAQLINDVLALYR